MRFKTLSDVNFKGKRVLVRSDLNSPISDNGVVLNDRIIESAKTISELKRKGAKVVVLAHQGQKGRADFVSLQGHVKLLNKFVKIKFVKDIFGERALEEIDNLKSGDALLLENVRFSEEEFKPDRSKIVRVLKHKFDYYVNDSFSVCHREHASIVGFPRVLPSLIGRTMEKELKNLDKIKGKGILFILGGNKIEDVTLLIKEKNILSTGVFSLVCLIAGGKNLGRESERLEEEKEYLEKIKRNLKNISLPVDLAVEVDGKRKEIKLSELPVNHRILDIGSETIANYEEKIMKARKIFWKGTAGDCSKEGFCEGTERLLKAMEKSPAFCVVAGGHSASAVKRFGIDKKKLGYVSLSGGALVYYISGRKLYGLEALEKWKR